VPQPKGCHCIDVLVVVRDDSDYGDLIRRTSATVSALSLQHDVVISRAFVSRERYVREQTPFLLNVRREGVPARISQSSTQSPSSIGR
jgi:hypothetical protein